MNYKDILLRIVLCIGASVGIIWFTTIICPSNVNAYNPKDRIELRVSSECSACKEAEALLKARGVVFTERSASSGKYVPQLYVNGKFEGYGVGAVEEYLSK